MDYENRLECKDNDNKTFCELHYRDNHIANIEAHPNQPQAVFITPGKDVRNLDALGAEGESIQDTEIQVGDASILDSERGRI